MDEEYDIIVLGTYLRLSLYSHRRLTVQELAWRSAFSQVFSVWRARRSSTSTVINTMAGTKLTHTNSHLFYRESASLNLTQVCSFLQFNCLSVDLGQISPGTKSSLFTRQGPRLVYWCHSKVPHGERRIDKHPCGIFSTLLRTKYSTLMLRVISNSSKSQVATSTATAELPKSLPTRWRYLSPFYMYWYRPFVPHWWEFSKKGEWRSSWNSSAITRKKILLLTKVTVIRW